MIKGGLFLAAFIVAFSGFAGASFACGLVDDSEGFSAGWLELDYYYADSPESKGKCRISPGNNKFCCDLLSLPSSWGIGKEAVTEMSDNSTGLFVQRASVFTSGEGYDVFPDREIRKAVRVDSAPDKINVGMQSAEFNVTLDDVFDRLSYRLLHSNFLVSESLICENCGGAEFNISLPDYGDYEVVFVASNPQTALETRFQFLNLEHLVFERRLECDGCSQDFVPRNRDVDVTVTVNASHSISGVLADHFPERWIFIEGGDASTFSESHKMIEWEFEGSFVEKTYRLRSPNDILPRRYIFFSKIEGMSSDHSIVFVAVNKILGMISSSPEFSEGRKSVGKEFSFVSRDFPLLIEGDDVVTEIAVFPDGEARNAFGSFERLDSAGQEHRFEIKSNIRGGRLDKAMIRFKWDKGEEPSLRAYEDGNWNELEITAHREEENYVIYEAFAGKTGVFSILY
jgi:hypothetical protein